MYGISIHDELTQPAVGQRAWRESFWFDVLDGDRGLLMYVGVQPGAGTGYGLVHLAEREGGVVFGRRDFALPVTAHEPDRSEIDIGPFHVSLVAPLQSQRIRFAGDGAEVAIDFTSRKVIYDYPWSWTRSRHYEQLGTAKATATLQDGTRLALHGGAARDHAWGLRSLRPWRSWLWVTSRAEGRPDWSACWVEDDERSQLLGHLVDEQGGAHTLRALSADVEYDDEGPIRAVLDLTFGKRAPMTVELRMFGQLDLSHADAAKRGGYFFAFADGEEGAGTFDVFWREGLDPLTKVVADDR